MEEEIKNQFDKHQELLEKIYNSVEKTRRYFLWTFIVSLVVIIIPFIILMFMLPSFINNLTPNLGGL